MPEKSKKRVGGMGKQLKAKSERIAEQKTAHESSRKTRNFMQSQPETS